MRAAWTGTVRSTTAVHASSFASAKGELARTQSARIQASGSGSRSCRACTASASTSPSSARRSRTYHCRSTSSPACSRTAGEVALARRRTGQRAQRGLPRHPRVHQVPRAVAATCASRPTRSRLGCPPLGGGEGELEARLGDRLDGLHRQHVGERADGLGGRRLAAGEHVPHGGHRHGAGQRRGQAGRAADQHLAAGGVGPGGGERGVVVVHQVEVGLGQALDGVRSPSTSTRVEPTSSSTSPARR